MRSPWGTSTKVRSQGVTFHLFQPTTTTPGRCHVTQRQLHHHRKSNNPDHCKHDHTQGLQANTVPTKATHKGRPPPWCKMGMNAHEQHQPPTIKTHEWRRAPQTPTTTSSPPHSIDNGHGAPTATTHEQRRASANADNSQHTQSTTATTARKRWMPLTSNDEWRGWTTTTNSDDRRWGRWGQHTHHPAPRMATSVHLLHSSPLPPSFPSSSMLPPSFPPSILPSIPPSLTPPSPPHIQCIKLYLCSYIKYIWMFWLFHSKYHK